MKQADKSKRTYEKIINAAIIEFGNQSYEGASLNNVCSKYQISKGLIYHNFKNKDDLYLQCTKQCFQKLSDFLSPIQIEERNIHSYLKKIINYRVQFFHENPAYCRFFFYTVLQPPKHLLKDIKQLRSTYDTFHIKQLKELIKQVDLRENISEEDAMEYYYYFQDMFNTYWGNKIYEGIDFDALIKEHETKLPKFIDMLLYGIAKEEEDVTTHN